MELDAIHKRFEVCPVCGSGKRFAETLAQMAKDRGLARDNWRFFFDRKQGVVLDNNKSVLIPIGAKAPTFDLTLDVCVDCGTVYAISLDTGETEIHMEKEHPRMPNLSLPIGLS